VKPIARVVAYRNGMARLLRDRYLPYDSQHAWDLATGESVPVDDGADQDECDDPPLPLLIEVLEHGREGTPRWIVADASPPVQSSRFLRRAAADARAHGFVPIAVHLYARLRDTLEEDLRDRTLLLMAGPRASTKEARGALVDAAARSARPHVLLTLRTAHDGGAGFVREAGAAYGAEPATAAGARRPPPIDADIAHHLRRGERAAEFIRLGRHAAAERLLRDVAGTLTRRGRLVHAARTLITLGQAILERGRAADADRVLEDAAIAAGNGSSEELIADARIWQAAARTDAGRLTEAESLCRAVMAAGRLDSASRVRAHATLARILLWQARVSEAAALDLAVDAEHDLDATSASFVGATSVRVLIANGRLFEAGVRARQLLTATIGGSALERLIASMAHFRVLAEAGDLPLAWDRLREAAALGRDARAPLRVARARLVWAAALAKAGRGSEARHELKRLGRLCAAAPPLLRRAVRDALRQMEAGGSSIECNRVRSLPDAAAAVRLVTLAYGEERDSEAVRRVLESVADAAQTSRIDLCSVDAGPTSTIMSVGRGLPTRLGDRVLDAGIVLGPEATDPGHELGVPARRGNRVAAAIVARWPADRIPPSGVRELLEIAAAVVCPRVEAMLTTARVSAQAATSVPELVGTSAAIADVRAAIARSAAAPFAVLIQGESGVGKELVARAIHQLSARRERRFCDVNCAALPEELLESELFGHARGAFTGAVSDRPGLFEAAHGGTVFLDELADLSARAQAKLLRVLQQHEVRRVGETFSRPVDVRLVTAANRDMSVEAESKRFRQDLLYRLDVIRIRIPPLRERPEDIALLAQHFWQASAPRVGTTAVLTHGVFAALSRYHWPGNVRELQNVMAALAVAAPSRGYVRTPLLPPAIAGAAAVTSARLADARAQFERRAIESALARAGGNRTRAARELGLSRQGLLKMMARLGLTKKDVPAT
jgi:DNA-binding NtrC family response regulator